MIIEFEKEYLRQLYSNDRCTNKDRVYDTVTIARYRVRVDTLMASESVEQLKTLKSWDLRKVDEEGEFSVCLDYGYRLEFRIRKSVCSLIDIIENS